MTSVERKPGGRTHSRIGLSTKLYVAIAGAVALTLTASVVAWISFVELGQIQRRITREHIPSIADSLRLARQSAEIAATAPSLLSAASDGERERVIGDLHGQVEVTENLIGRIETEITVATDGARHLIDDIRGASQELSAALDRLDRSVRNQHELTAVLKQRADRAVALHRRLIGLLTPMLDDATLFLVTGYRDLSDAAPVSPDRRYTEETLLNYTAMAQLGIEANLIGGLLAEAANIPNAALLQPLRERIEAANDRFRNALEVVGRGVATAALGETFAELGALGIGVDSIPALRRDLLAEQQAATGVTQEAREISGHLTADVDDLVAEVEARTKEAVAASNRAIDVGRTLLLVLNGVSILGALLIGWAYVGRHITAPIVRITDAAAAFEEQHFEASRLAGVRQRRDELGDLARTFTRMAEEVQARTDTLDRLVAERTAELNKKNAALERSQARVETELEIARSLQMAILPQNLPDDPGYAGKAAMVPAREMGGDFYDFFPVGENTIGLVIADVSGKGVSAAFFMAISRTIMQGSAREAGSPGQCLAAANDLLCEQNPLDLFVTVFYGVLDIATGEFRYANGGHNPPLVARAGGGVTPLPGTGGMAMGVMPGIVYKEDSVHLTPGDTLLLYTDGISEAMDREGREFTEARLVDSLSEGYRQSVDVVVSSVMQAVKQFVGDAPQSDDITCLVLRYKGPGGESLGEAAE